MPQPAPKPLFSGSVLVRPHRHWAGAKTRLLPEETLTNCFYSFIKKFPQMAQALPFHMYTS
jgi:hypothetical protein